MLAAINKLRNMDRRGEGVAVRQNITYEYGGRGVQQSIIGLQGVVSDNPLLYE